MSELLAVRPAFARQFPYVLAIEDDRDAFFAAAGDLIAAKATAEGAVESKLISPEDGAPLHEGVSAAAGAGPMAEKAGRTSVRSAGNLVGAALVGSAVGGFVSGEMLGGLGDAFEVDLRKVTETFVRARRQDLEELMANAPADQRQAFDLNSDTLLDPRRQPKPQPPRKTHVVDLRQGHGDFTSIKAAVDAAESGDRIVVLEGTYHKSIDITKSLEIAGEGDVDKVVIVGLGQDALYCDAEAVRLSGFHVVHAAGKGGNAIFFTGGSAEVEHRLIENSGEVAAILIMGADTRATLRHCTVRDAASDGLFVHSGAKVEAENCRFSRHTSSGVSAMDRNTHAILRSCVVEEVTRKGSIFWMPPRPLWRTARRAELLMKGSWSRRVPTRSCSTVSYGTTVTQRFMYMLQRKPMWRAARSTLMAKAGSSCKMTGLSPPKTPWLPKMGHLRSMSWTERVAGRS